MRTLLLVLAVAIMGCAPPPGPAANPDDILLVGHKGKNTLSLIALKDFASGTVTRRLNAGKNGDGLAIAPSPKR